MSDLTVLDLNIFLASGSPRRLSLLQEAGFTRVRQQSIDVEETYPQSMSIDEIPLFLARKKADAAQNHILPGELMLTGDSIVTYGDQVLGKPANKQEAYQVLSTLSGESHRVLTGVCLRRGDQEQQILGCTQVHFYPLTSAEIEYYVSQYAPYDKAGSYGIQEWIGWCAIRSIEGSYSNVMGLPIAQVYQTMNRYFT